MAFREQGHVPFNRFVALGNIDRQDRQDEKLLHRKLTGSMIGCACEVIHEPWERVFGILVQEKVMIELKTLKPLTRPSCLSCPSM